MDESGCHSTVDAASGDSCAEVVQVPGVSSAADVPSVESLVSGQTVRCGFDGNAKTPLIEIPDSQPAELSVEDDLHDDWRLPFGDPLESHASSSHVQAGQDVAIPQEQYDRALFEAMQQFLVTNHLKFRVLQVPCYNPLFLTALSSFEQWLTAVWIPECN